MEQRAENWMRRVAGHGPGTSAPPPPQGWVRVQHIISIRTLPAGFWTAFWTGAETRGTGGLIPACWRGRSWPSFSLNPAPGRGMSLCLGDGAPGGTSISVDSVEASSIAKGETLADTIRVVSGYADANRAPAPQGSAARLASEFATVPVINAGDAPASHPPRRSWTCTRLPPVHAPGRPGDRPPRGPAATAGPPTPWPMPSPSTM